MNNKLLILLVLSLFLSSSSSANPTTNYYWTNFKASLHSYFFPTPNLDFRGGGSSSSPPDDEPQEAGVTHAASMSLDMTKSTIDDSAKSAASLAKQAAHKLLHNPFSHDDDNNNYSPDL